MTHLTDGPLRADEFGPKEKKTHGFYYSKNIVNVNAFHLEHFHQA